jgi:hypothetical protein
MNGLPAGWRISVDGAHVLFEVPASAADGFFELSDAEALAVGERLIELAERAGLVRRALDGGIEDALREQRPGFIEQLERDAKDPSRAVRFRIGKTPIVMSGPLAGPAIRERARQLAGGD